MEPLSPSPINKPFKIQDKKLQTHEEKSMEIFFYCLSEDIQEFLTEIHTPDEYKKKGEDLDNVIFILDSIAYDTTHLKDSLSELYRKKKDL